MREPYTEGAATHGGPGPCVGDPRGRSEALDRGTRRPAIEPRNQPDRGADVVTQDGRQHSRRRYARAVGGPRAVGEPMHARSLHAREPGDPMSALPPARVRAARGRRKPYARDVRSWEVGLPRSTCEAAEQRRASGHGGGGGKEAARGERGQRHVPRTQSRIWHVKGAGSCASAWDLTEQAFDPSEEPSAVIPHAGICAGGRPKGRSLPRPRCGVAAA
jgi:hypothetical protein